MAPVELKVGMLYRMSILFRRPHLANGMDFRVLRSGM